MADFEKVSIERILGELYLGTVKTSGSNIVINVTPYGEDKKKVQIIINAEKESRYNYIIDDVDSFDNVGFPYFLASLTNTSKLSDWNIDKDDTENVYVGTSFTESGISVNYTTTNENDFNTLNDKINACFKPVEDNPVNPESDVRWDKILTYIKRRLVSIDVNGLQFTDKETKDFYSMIERLAEDSCFSSQQIYSTDRKKTFANIQSIFTDEKLIEQLGVSKEFVSKVLTNVSYDVLTDLTINEKRYSKVKKEYGGRVDFALTQLNGAKGKYFQSRDKKAAIERLKNEYSLDTSITFEKRSEYIEYCNELLDYIADAYKDSVSRELIVPLDYDKDIGTLVPYDYLDDFDAFADVWTKLKNDGIDYIVTPIVGIEEDVLILKLQYSGGSSKENSYTFGFSNKPEVVNQFVDTIKPLVNGVNFTYDCFMSYEQMHDYYTNYTMREIGDNVTVVDKDGHAVTVTDEECDRIKFAVFWEELVGSSLKPDVDKKLYNSISEYYYWQLTLKNKVDQEEVRKIFAINNVSDEKYRKLFGKSILEEYVCSFYSSEIQRQQNDFVAGKASKNNNSVEFYKLLNLNNRGILTEIGKRHFEQLCNQSSMFFYRLTMEECTRYFVNINNDPPGDKSSFIGCNTQYNALLFQSEKKYNEELKSFVVPKEYYDETKEVSMDEILTKYPHRDVPIEEQTKQEQFAEYLRLCKDFDTPENKFKNRNTIIRLMLSNNYVALAEYAKMLSVSEVAGEETLRNILVLIKMEIQHDDEYINEELALEYLSLIKMRSEGHIDEVQLNRIEELEKDTTLRPLINSIEKDYISKISKGITDNEIDYEKLSKEMFEKSSVYGFERRDSIYHFFDRKTGLEYTPKTNKEWGEIVLGQKMSDFKFKNMKQRIKAFELFSKCYVEKSIGLEQLRRTLAEKCNDNGEMYQNAITGDFDKLFNDVFEVSIRERSRGLYQINTRGIMGFSGTRVLEDGEQSISDVLYEKIASGKVKNPLFNKRAAKNIDAGLKSIVGSIKRRVLNSEEITPESIIKDSRGGFGQNRFIKTMVSDQRDLNRLVCAVCDIHSFFVPDENKVNNVVDSSARLAKIMVSHKTGA